VDNDADQMSNHTKVIIITGTMGAGKTTLMAEASDLLTAQGIMHAAIDLDALALACLPQKWMADIAYRNLAAVWSNYRAAGAKHLLLANAVESQAVLNRIREAVQDAEFVICRLKVNLPTAQARVRSREPGMFQDKFVAWAGELDKILDEARLEDFFIQNDDGCVTELAQEMLKRAGWMK
jgi:adenylylsulfate kinase